MEHVYLVLAQALTVTFVLGYLSRLLLKRNPYQSRALLVLAIVTAISNGACLANPNVPESVWTAMGVLASGLFVLSRMELDWERKLDAIAQQMDKKSTRRLDDRSDT